MMFVRCLLSALLFVAALLLPTASASAETAACGGPIAYGADGECAGSEVDGDRWTFEGAEGDIVTIEMEGEDFDTYLELYGPDGDLLIDADDSPGSTDARIEAFGLPVGGTYTILARGFGLETGSYVLRLRLVEPGSGERGIGLPNPASVYCEENGGRLELRQDEQGNQTGFCVFADGSECEEWAFYRGECAPGEKKAQTPERRIALGETVEGEITSDDGDIWLFDGQAGDVVTIAMGSEDFDAYLELQGPDGDELAWDDDSGPEFDALIEGFTLPKDGTYAIVAQSWRGETGPYVLSLSAGGEQGETPLHRIAYGETVEGELPEGEEDLWSFEGEAGDIVTISLSSEAFDAYLELNGPEGDELASDDDSGDGYGALLSAFELPETGSYTIVVSSWDGEPGPYELSLTSGGERGGRAEQRIAYGQAVEGELSADEPDRWVFEGQAGDVVTIALDSGAFDAYLELDGPEGDELASDDDSGTHYNALISGFELPESGDYTIVVYAWGGEPGPYQLSLVAGAGGGAEEGGRGGTPPERRIAYGESVEGSLSTADGDAWAFEGQAGDVVTIALSSEAFDAYLELYGPAGGEVASDDDSGEGYDALLSEFELPESGLYTIVVSAWSDEVGPYVLSLEGSQGAGGEDQGDTGPDRIAYGDTVEDELAEGEGDAWVFEGQAGDVVTIALSSDVLDVYLELDGPDGDEVAWDDDGGEGTDALIAEFVLPETGAYTILVQAWGGDEGAYTLTLEGSAGVQGNE